MSAESSLLENSNSTAVSIWIRGYIVCSNTTTSGRVLKQLHLNSDFFFLHSAYCLYSFRDALLNKRSCRKVLSYLLLLLFCFFFNFEMYMSFKCFFFFFFLPDTISGRIWICLSQIWFCFYLFFFHNCLLFLMFPDHQQNN